MYVVAGIVILFFLIFLIGLALPKMREEARRVIINAPIQSVYTTVADNENWTYRSDLQDLIIIERAGGREVWDEVSKNGVAIRFKTKKKIPYSYYSFDMECKMFTGYWEACLTEMGEIKLFLRLRNILL